MSQTVGDGALDVPKKQAIPPNKIVIVKQPLRQTNDFATFLKEFTTVKNLIKKDRKIFKKVLTSQNMYDIIA